VNQLSRILLAVAIIFSCIVPISAQQPKPPEQTNTRPRQDQQADVISRDFRGAPGSSKLLTGLSAQEKKACDRLLRAAERGRTDEARRLLATGVPANTCGTLALLTTSLKEPIGIAQIEFAKVLLAAGADPRVWMLVPPHGGIATPLKLAQDYKGPDKEKVAGELLEAMLAAERKLGWKPEYCLAGREGAPLIFLAILFGDASQVEMLLVRGADANQRGCRGATALMVAAERGEPETVKALITAGADLNAQMEDGATALSVAMQKGRTEIAHLLKRAGAKQ
jgi:hypothetical protein